MLSLNYSRVVLNKEQLLKNYFSVGYGSKLVMSDDILFAKYFYFLLQKKE